MKKIILRVLLGLAVIILLAISYILIAYDKKFEAPMPSIIASNDPAVIERGRYLAFGPAHCATCHTAPENFEAMMKGEAFPMAGGFEINIPPGHFRAPNITPDKETGIGAYTDAELARAMRHSVKRSGRVLFPFMPYQNMSDADLTALVSFMRAQKPVKHEVKPSEYTFLGKFIVAFGLLKPESPKTAPPASVVIDSSVAYGEYIANHVANCMGCHTARDMKSGKFTGPAFAGGMVFPPEAISKGYGFQTPNLTPDEETGVMAGWNESTFVTRFASGRVHAGSPMPWENFANISRTEAKAIYAYLMSLKPVKNKIEKTVYKPGEKLPEGN